jgi:DUF1009 family protein
MIAGDGELPIAIARAGVRAGRRVVAVAFPGVTAPALEQIAARICWLDPGRVGAALEFLRGEAVTQAVMAGKVSKDALVRGGLEIDDRGRRLLARVSDWNDATLLGALADELAAEGIELLAQALWVPEWVVEEGVLGQVHPTAAQREAIALGWPAARAAASLDIGQTVVVHERTIVAVEAIEGTDETIRRAGRLGGPGLCIVKVARPQQDPRFDLPAIGPGTVAVAAEVGAGVIAVEAARSLVLEREMVVEQANAAGIALVGIPTAGPETTSSGEAD